MLSFYLLKIILHAMWIRYITTLTRYRAKSNHQNADIDLKNTIFIIRKATQEMVQNFSFFFQTVFKKTVEAARRALKSVFYIIRRIKKTTIFLLKHKSKNVIYNIKTIKSLIVSLWPDALKLLSLERCFLNKYILFFFYSIFLKLGNNKGGGNILIHVPLWGDEYYKTFMEFTLSSFLSKENKLATQTKKIKILFTCSKAIKKKMTTDKKFLEFRKYYDAIFIIFPDSFFEKLSQMPCKNSLLYCVLGFMQFIATKISIATKSDFMPFFCDVLVEKQFFDKIINLRNSHDVIYTNVFRSDLIGVRDHLNQCQGANFNTLDLSAQEIVDLQCRYLHKETINRLISPTKKEVTITPQLIFKQGNTLLAKTFHWSPIFIKHTALKNLKLHLFIPIDTYFSKNYENNGNENVYHVTDPTQLALCELSYQHKVGMTEKIEKSLSFEKFLVNRLNNFNLTEKNISKLRKTAVYKPNHSLDLKYEDIDLKWFDEVLLDSVVTR